MGSRGPLPVPGSSESRRGRNTLRAKGPAREHGPVEPPDAVLQSPAALAFWRVHAPLLTEAGRLKPEHAAAFGIVCAVAAEVEFLAARVAAEGLVMRTERGSLRPHPAARLLRDARRDLMQFGAAFGLTAAAAARLPLPPEDDEDVLDEFDARLAEYAARRSRGVAGTP